MREVWFGAVPKFVRSGGNRGCWAAIFEVDDRIRDFHPYPFVEIEFCDNGLDPFHNGAVGAFCDSVLVGTVWRRRFMNDSGTFEMSFHPFFVFSAAICSQSLDYLSTLLFHFRLVLPELLQYRRR